MGVIVDDHINSIGNCRIDHRFDTVHIGGRIQQVIGIISIPSANRQGSAYDIGVPITS